MSTFIILLCATVANAMFNVYHSFSEKTIAEKQVFYTKAIFRFLIYGALLGAGVYLDLINQIISE